MKRLTGLAMSGVLAFWLLTMLGYGNLALLGIVVAVFGCGCIICAKGFLLRRRHRAFGESLKFATSVLTNRRRWANLAEVLDLTVRANVRRSRSVRLASAAVGRSYAPRSPIRVIPAVLSMAAAPYGMAVSVAAAAGQSLETWQRRTGHLSLALKVQKVSVLEPRPGVIELHLRTRDPLESPIVVSGLRPALAWALPLGIDEHGMSISGSCRNVSGVVVGGVPGGGKSAWLSMALASLAEREDVQWLLIDGKQGYDLEALAARSYRYVSGEEAGDLEVVKAALQDAQTLMVERLRYSRELYGHSNLWSVGPSRLHPAVVVVIDECQTYLDPKSFPTKETKAVGAEIDSIVRDRVKRGRSAGIVVILSTQRPTADSIPTSTRDNCGLRVCFSVRTREAAAAVLGEFSTETSVNPIGAPTGVGVSSVAGREVRFRSPFVPEHVIRGHIESTAVLAANPLDLLCGALMDRVSRDGEGCGDTCISHTDSSDTCRPRPAREPLT